MANSDNLIQALSNLCAKLQKEMTKTSQKRIEIDQMVAEFERHIQAVETTIHLIKHNGRPSESDAYNALVAKLKDEKRKSKLTQMQALETIATTIGNKGTIKIREAKRVMLNAGLIANPKNADRIIYALINKSSRFEKESPGKYKLVFSGHLAKSKRTRKGLKTSRKQKEVSGVLEAIKALKEANPSLTKAEALSALTRQGFDFKGRRPGNAVNMSWMSLGYTKQEAQRKEKKEKNIAFNDEVIQKVWGKGIVDQNNPKEVWRKDCCDAWIARKHYGNRQSQYGWEIDYIKSPSEGGGDEPSNLRPLHWQNYVGKQSGRTVCTVTSSGAENIRERVTYG
jgi:hypothetical protein